MKYIYTLILVFFLAGVSSAQQIYTAAQINSYGNFESYNSFSTSFPPFTTYDGDGQNEYQLNGISWPNGDVPQAFMVFDPQSTTPAMEVWWLHPRSGTKLLKAMCNRNANANNWFITPKVQLLGGHPYVSFWVFTYHTFYQRIRVSVSTTTNDMNSFELISPGDYLEAPIVGSAVYQGPNGWKEMKFDLSKYANKAVYIAINQITPPDGIMVAIDDFFIEDGESGANIPIVDFASNLQEINEGGSISFTNQTQNSVSQYQWKFSGGTPETSTAVNPTVSYANEGTYMVSLTATNSYGTDNETKYAYIKVNGNNSLKPVAQFTSGQRQVLINTGVAFQDASTNSPTVWNWEFPGGSPGISTSQNPQVSYPYPGNYDVILTAVNQYGQTTRMKTSYIQVGDENGYVPLAKFNADNNIIYTGESVNFTDLSTNSPNSWSWSFEGGNPAYSTSQNPTVRYMRQGVYAVSLTCTNATGSSTTTEKGYITVTENPNTGYCAAGVDQMTSGYYIATTSIGNYTKNSTLGSNGYSDYSTSISASFNAGDAIPFSAIASNTWTSKLYAYVDWNEDFDFNDPNEFVFLDSIAPYTGNIAIPQGVEPGEKRLRIRLSLYGAPESCGNLQFGETEDYTIKINGTKDITAPTTPSNLVSTDITETTISLSWNASTDENGVTAYFIYADDEIIGASSGLSFIAQSLLPNTNYNFYVKASDAVGNISNKSNAIIVKTNSIGGDNEAPTAPSNLVGSNITQTSVNLSWTASTDNVGVIGYDVYQGASIVKTVTTTSTSITGLTANTAYAFSVKAKDAAGNVSAASNTVNVTTLGGDTQSPTAPSNLASSNITQTSVDLSWTASTDNVGVTGYDVYQGGSFVKTITTTSTSITGLTANTTYAFSVRAKDAAGNISQASNTLNVTTLGNSDDGGALINGVAASGNMDQADGADMWYIEVGPNATSMRVVLETGTSDFDTYGKFNAQPTTSSYDWRGYTSGGEDNTINNPQEGRHYIMVDYYSGSGPYTLTVTIVYNTTDTEAPSAPSNLISSNITQTSVDLSWTASIDNVGVTGYDVYQGTSLVQTVTTTNTSITGLTANTAYSFSVKAKDAAGNISVSSNALNITTLGNPDDGGQLTDGVASSGNMDQADGSDMWYIEVGPNAKSMRVVLETGRSDFDTYGKFNAEPTTSSYDWRGYTSEGEDNIINNPQEGRHYIMVNYYSGSGSYTLTASITYNREDTEAPSAPTNLTSSNITQTSVDLSWTASTDNVGVTGYDVYQGNSVVQNVTTASVSVTGLLAGSNYTFSVKAKDAAGNVSTESNQLSITTLEENISYCDATHNNPLSYFYIKNVSFGSINNSTTLGNTTSGYSDYTSQSTSVNAGSSYNLSVNWTPSWSTNSAKVYIDWNRDGDFDDVNETVMNVSGASIPYSVSVVVPSTAVTGSTRMRVRVTYNGSIIPCGALYWGETEDYTINVSASTPGQSFAENSILDAQIYPNPASEVLNICLLGANSAKIQLINVSGQTIKNFNLTRNKDEIDISDLQKGLYLIKIFSNNNVLLKKVLIE